MEVLDNVVIICPYCNEQTKLDMLHDLDVEDEVELKTFICLLAVCNHCHMLYRYVQDKMKCLSHSCEGCKTTKPGIELHGNS